MHPERERFEAAIQADRYDQVTRLVFADWLEEHDDPEAADEQRRWTPEWQRSDDWIDEFCDRVDLNRDYFLKEAARCLDRDDDAGDETGVIECHINTSNATTDENMAEMWKQVAIYLRRSPVDGKTNDPFTCGGNCFPAGVTRDGKCGLEDDDDF